MLRQLLATGLFIAAGTLVEAVAESYDYIVVGSGPGGAPLAANLVSSLESFLSPFGNFWPQLLLHAPETLVKFCSLW